jgi:type VI secretion system protein ImpE
MSPDIEARLTAGELDAAIELMNAQVRARPTDTEARSELVELLCIAGDIDRADRLLEAIASLDTSTGVGVAMIRQLLRAEQARKQFYAEGRAPEFLAAPDPLLTLELKAATLLREGDAAAAAALVAERDEARAELAGKADGAAFDDFRDLDDLCAAHLEVLTSNGKYFWVPLTSVISMELRKPERRRDLLWRRAHLSVAGGPDGEVFLPAIYETAGSTGPQRLGLETDFGGVEGGPLLGLGQRSFLVGDDVKTILELGEVEFTAALATSG